MLLKGMVWQHVLDDVFQQGVNLPPREVFGHLFHPDVSAGHIV